MIKFHYDKPCCINCNRDPDKADPDRCNRRRRLYCRFSHIAAKLQNQSQQRRANSVSEYIPDIGTRVFTLDDPGSNPIRQTKTDISKETLQKCRWQTTSVQKAFSCVLTACSLKSCSSFTTISAQSSFAPAKTSEKRILAA